MKIADKGLPPTRTLSAVTGMGGTMTAEVVDHVIYTAFGNPSQGAAFAGDPLPRFGFDGLRYDAATGFDFTATRRYDPSTGTWIQPDPIGFSGRAGQPERVCGQRPDEFRRSERAWADFALG